MVNGGRGGETILPNGGCALCPRLPAPTNGGLAPAFEAGESLVIVRVAGKHRVRIYSRGSETRVHLLQHIRAASVTAYHLGRVVHRDNYRALKIRAFHLLQLVGQIRDLLVAYPRGFSVLARDHARIFEHVAIEAD